MRGVHLAVLAVAFLLLGSLASAQGIGAAAAKEKERRKATPEGKVYTESDLGPSMAPVGQPTSLPATTEEDAEPEDDAEGSEEGEDVSEEDRKAEAEAAWRRKLEQARKEEEVYKEVIDRLQLELNDISGGVYNPGRANRVAFLEENKQLLAQTQEKITALEAEGRANAYRQ